MSKKKMTQKEIGEGCAGVVLIIVCIFFFRSCIFNNDEEKESVPKTTEELREIQIKKCFNPWNGSVQAVIEKTKGAMNDPSSFEHIETKFVDVSPDFRVGMTFTGKNQYGGRTKHTVIMDVDSLCRFSRVMAFDDEVFFDMNTGLSNSIPTSKKSNSFSGDSIDLKFDVEFLFESNYLKVIGTTNLPDGAVLWLTVEKGIEYITDWEIFVSKGKFESKRLQMNGKGIRKPFNLELLCVFKKKSHSKELVEELRRYNGKYIEKIPGSNNFKMLYFMEVK
ncbi:MAG: hypothetical protein ACI9YL_001736 [Luteibaculaceae bacterium]|jgi:hypothetical protein